MKKNFKGIVLLLVTVMLVATLACGCKKNDAIVGTWTMTEIGYGDSTMSIADMAKMSGQDESAMKATMTFNADGNAELNAAGEVTKATWKKDGKAYIVTSDDGQDQSVTIEDKKLVVGDETMKMYFTK